MSNIKQFYNQTALTCTVVAYHFNGSTSVTILKLPKHEGWDALIEVAEAKFKTYVEAISAQFGRIIYYDFYCNGMTGGEEGNTWLSRTQAFYPLSLPHPSLGSI